MKKTNSLKVTIDDLCLIKPMTRTQSRILKDWDDHSVMVLYGSAGTGKSFIPIYKALEDYLTGDKDYEKVILIRSAVPSRDIGALPGTEEEKGAPYEQAYQQIFSDLFPKKQSAYSTLTRENKVVFSLTSFIKGVTFDDCVIIADEAQNMSYNELYNLVTRVGQNTRIVFCGDTKQSDLGNKSGYGRFMQVLDKMESARMYRFTSDDIVRSGIVKEFIMADESI